MESTGDLGEAGYKDQSGWLTAFGVFELFAAAVIGLLKFRSLATLHATGTDALATYSLVMGFGEVVKRIILGWGSIKARRWARSILIIVSWFNLGVGLLLVPSMFWMMNHLPINDPRVSPHFRMIIGFIVSGFTFVISVVIPWVFIRFYSRPDVKETCEARNPNPSWTDPCPLPVLGLALFLALGASYMLLTLLLPGFQFPILIWTLGGVSSKMVMLLWAAASLYGAYGLYRLSMSGFTLTVALTSLGLVNGGVFYAAKGWDGFMSLTGQNFHNLKEMQATMLVIKPLFGIMMLATSAGLIAYLVFLKRSYFLSPSDPDVHGQ